MTAVPELPDAIGPYRVVARLGRGGMGEVLRGYDDRLGRPIALKRVLPNVRDVDTALRRFRREARAVARLNHPSIVQVHDWVEADDQHWLVMELVDGQSLAERLRDGPLPMDEVLALGRDIADGLAEAHDAGIVHRDLKASNIMVTAKGRAKILDFGLAKSVRVEESTTESLGPVAVSSASLTGEGRIVGTVTNMSPEQAMGRPVDHRSDLFSLGVVLYEMASGASPFVGATPLETLQRICSVQPTPLVDLDAAIPRGFSHLVEHLLEKDPPQRPANGHDVVRVIDRLTRSMSGGAVESLELVDQTTLVDERAASTRDGVPPVDDLTPPARRQKHSVSLGVVGLIVVALGLWGLTWWLESSAKAVDTPRSIASQLEADEPTTFELYRRGMVYLESPEREGHIDRAIRTFQRVLAKDQDFVPALAGLSEAYCLDFVDGSLDPQRLDQALAVARQAVELDEHLAVAWVSLGLALAEAKRLDDASQAFDTALGLEPSNPNALTGLGEVRQAQGNVDEAERLYRLAAEVDPRRAEFLGLLYLDSGRLDEAADAFSRSLDAVPENYRNLSNLGVVFYMQGRLPEAAEQFQKALLIRPDSSLYSNVGTIYFTQGLYAQSVGAFTKAIETGGSNDYLLWGNLGDAKRWTPGLEDEARDAYARAIQLVRKGIEAGTADRTDRTRLVVYSAKRGDCEQAADEIRFLGAIPLEDGSAWYRVAVAYEVCDARDRAFIALGHALQARFPLEEIHRDPELLDLRRDVQFHELSSEYSAR